MDEEKCPALKEIGQISEENRQKLDEEVNNYREKEKKDDKEFTENNILAQALPDKVYGERVEAALKRIDEKVRTYRSKKEAELEGTSVQRELARREVWLIYCTKAYQEAADEKKQRDLNLWLQWAEDQATIRSIACRAADLLAQYYQSEGHASHPGLAERIDTMHKDFTGDYFELPLPCHISENKTTDEYRGVGMPSPIDMCAVYHRDAPGRYTGVPRFKDITEVIECARCEKEFAPLCKPKEELCWECSGACQANGITDANPPTIGPQNVFGVPRKCYHCSTLCAPVWQQPGAMVTCKQCSERRSSSRSQASQSIAASTPPPKGSVGDEDASRPVKDEMIKEEVPQEGPADEIKDEQPRYNLRIIN